MAHIWFNKLYLKYEKTCFTFALKYEKIFSSTQYYNQYRQNPDNKMPAW